MESLWRGSKGVKLYLIRNQTSEPYTIYLHEGLSWNQSFSINYLRWYAKSWFSSLFCPFPQFIGPCSSSILGPPYFRPVDFRGVKEGIQGKGKKEGHKTHTCRISHKLQDYKASQYTISSKVLQMSWWSWSCLLERTESLFWRHTSKCSERCFWLTLGRRSPLQMQSIKRKR